MLNVLGTENNVTDWGCCEVLRDKHVVGFGVIVAFVDTNRRTEYLQRYLLSRLQTAMNHSQSAPVHSG